MAAHLVKDQAEFINAYFYEEKYALKNLPEEYPCILVITHSGGGIGGSNVEHEIDYFPKDVNIHTYFSGFNLALSKYCP
jgi:hypothetical protein|tara:strand:+ start:18620 stop:18856 length:237 start_codon:yes stop_codon:yes gene_type:complete